MRGCEQWSPVYSWKDLRIKPVSNPGPLDLQANAKPTELPGLLKSYLVFVYVFSIPV